MTVHSRRGAIAAAVAGGGTAPAFVSAAAPAPLVDSTNSPAPITIPVPTGGPGVDLVIVSLATGTWVASPPGGLGFNLIGSAPYTVTTTDGWANSMRFYLYWRFADGTETGNYAFTVNTGRPTTGRAMRFNGCDPVAPIDTMTPGWAIGSGSANTPSVSGTTTNANDLLVWIGLKYGTSASCTYPSGWTGRAATANTTLVGAGGTGALNHMVATKAQPSAGASGAVVGTWDTADGTAAFLIGLKKP
jgi:hypothetical protein